MYPKFLRLCLLGGLLVLWAGLGWADEAPPDPTGTATIQADPNKAVNFAWTLMTGFLVFFMQAGFALVEAGLSRAKNAVAVLTKNFMDCLIGGLAFWAFGFAFMFGGSGAAPGTTASEEAGALPRRYGSSRVVAKWALAGLLGWCLLQTPFLWAQEDSTPETPPASQGAPADDPSPLKDLQWNGHVAVSYNYNFNGPVNAFRVFDEGTRQVTLHQAEFWLEKPSSAESPIGFGVDVVLGSDAKKIHATGLGNADDPFDLTQAYITYKVPVGAGLDLKVGKFVTLHGAEVIRRSGNFNVSRSVLFGYAIPFTHTGLMATYPFSDRFTVTLGVVNGWDNVTDNNTGKSLHGMVTVLPLKDLTLTVGGTWGPEQADTNGPKRSLLDVVATYKPAPPLTLIVNFDYGVEADAVPDETGGSKTARWYGAAGYLLYDLDDRWSVGLRGEFFIDREGFRLGWTDPSTGLPARCDLWELTGTVRYKVVDRLLASLEYRHDFANHRVFDGGPDGLKKAQGTILVELIYLLK